MPGLANQNTTLPGARQRGDQMVRLLDKSPGPFFVIFLKILSQGFTQLRKSKQYQKYRWTKNYGIMSLRS